MKLLDATDYRVVTTLKWYFETFPEQGDAGFERYFLCKIVEIDNKYYLKFSNTNFYNWFILTTSGFVEAKYIQPFDFSSGRTVTLKGKRDDSNCSRTNRERVFAGSS